MIQKPNAMFVFHVEHLTVTRAEKLAVIGMV